MLKDIIDNKLIEARGIVGFYRANTVNKDDIEIYAILGNCIVSQASNETFKQTSTPLHKLASGKLETTVSLVLYLPLCRTNKFCTFF